VPNGALDAVFEQSCKNSPPGWWTATAKSKAVAGLAPGIAFVHSLGLLHRDLKPGNIFTDEECEIRIADFGRARKTSVEISVAPGSPLTQAPEAWSDGGYLNKVDVYLFAVTLCCLLAEANRLDDKPETKISKNPTAVMRRICSGARFVKDEKIPGFYWHLITVPWHAALEQRPSSAALLKMFEKKQDWVFPGTNEEKLAAYEAKVWCEVPIPDDKERLQTHHEASA
jgi:serine/threonine protein kinase